MPRVHATEDIVADAVPQGTAGVFLEVNPPHQLVLIREHARLLNPGTLGLAVVKIMRPLNVMEETPHVI